MRCALRAPQPRCGTGSPGCEIELEHTGAHGSSCARVSVRARSSPTATRDSRTRPARRCRPRSGCANPRRQGELLIDERTHRLVRTLVDVEETGEHSRLVLVRPDATGLRRCRFDSPMVGRERERRRLHDALRAGDSGSFLSAVHDSRSAGRREIAPRSGVRRRRCGGSRSSRAAAAYHTARGSRIGRCSRRSATSRTSTMPTRAREPGQARGSARRGRRGGRGRRSGSGR